jgi:hypothetical protein
VTSTLGIKPVSTRVRGRPGVSAIAYSTRTPSSPTTQLHPTALDLRQFDREAGARAALAPLTTAARSSRSLHRFYESAVLG